MLNTVSDPFAGIKLSEAAPAPEPPTDQRLFSTVRSQRPSGSSPKVTPPTQEVGKEGRREVSQEVSQEASQEARKEAGEALDLNQVPHRKDSFLFTEGEFEALEDLKLELRRKHGLRAATKNDIARASLHHIVEDYQRNPERSIVVSRLKRKTRP